MSTYNVTTHVPTESIGKYLTSRGVTDPVPFIRDVINGKDRSFLFNLVRHTVHFSHVGEYSYYDVNLDNLVA
jgi:hypothetical protein